MFWPPLCFHKDPVLILNEELANSVYETDCAVISWIKQECAASWRQRDIPSRALKLVTEEWVKNGKIPLLALGAIGWCGSAVFVGDFYKHRYVYVGGIVVLLGAVQSMAWEIDAVATRSLLCAFQGRVSSFRRALREGI